MDAPILVPNMWMHIPKSWMPNKAFRQQNNGSARNDQDDASTVATHSSNHFANNVLRHNTHRTVSTLDIIPTLRDLLNYSTIYTDDQKRTCATGISLLSQWIPQGRIVVGWNGKPLNGLNLGTFSNESDSLFYSLRRTAKSRLVEIKFDDEKPLYALFQTPLEDVEKSKLGEWRELLERQGWFDHGLVESRMPLLHEVLT
jgi:hypothetical protein